MSTVTGSGSLAHLSTVPDVPLAPGDVLEDLRDPSLRDLPSATEPVHPDGFDRPSARDASDGGPEGLAAIVLAAEQAPEEVGDRGQALLALDAWEGTPAGSRMLLDDGAAAGRPPCPIGADDVDRAAGSIVLGLIAG